jgi:hypothetical protein
MGIGLVVEKGAIVQKEELLWAIREHVTLQIKPLFYKEAYLFVVKTCKF